MPPSPHSGGLTECQMLTYAKIFQQTNWTVVYVHVIIKEYRLVAHCSEVYTILTLLVMLQQKV